MAPTRRDEALLYAVATTVAALPPLLYLMDVITLHELYWYSGLLGPMFLASLAVLWFDYERNQ